MRILIHFARFGPYHHARLRAAHEVLSPLGWEVIGLETAGNDATYAWDETKGDADGPKVITAFPGRVHEEITAAEFRQTLKPLLDSLQPTAMAIAGWGSTDAVTCLSWCRKHKVFRIVMSETRAADGHRVWWKEFIKGFIIRRFDGALVGAKSHRDYLATLGMQSERIAFGYNVVDNGYFVAKTQDFKTQDARLHAAQKTAQQPDQAPGTKHQAQQPYFLASNRFIERKNLLRLVEAYAEYVESDQCRVIRDQEEEEDRDQRPETRIQMPLQRFGKTSAAESNQRPEARDHRSGEARIQTPSMRADGSERPSLPSTINNPQSSIINPSSSIPPSPHPPLSPSPAPWHLCLLGDGELKGTLLAKCAELGLQVIEAAPWEVSEAQSTKHKAPGTVYMPGFRQIDELPHFYAHAGCFIHPALEEPWGLVINEAMACGLPVLSSHNVGAAEELVDDGVNGWNFEPGEVASIAEAMGRLASLPAEELEAFGAASRRILEERGATRAFGEGLARLLAASPRP